MMKRFVFSAALVLMLAGAAYAQSDLQPIANVKLQKSEPITMKQLKARIEAYQKELGRSMTLDDRKQVLDMLINERLVVQAAERDGLKISDSEVNQNFTQMISQQVNRPVTEIEFAQMVKEKTGMQLDDFMRNQNGMTVAEYKSFLKSQLLAQRYVMAKHQAELQSVAGPTDTEIRSNYDLYKQNFVQPDMLKLFLVMVPKGDNIADSRAKLADLQKQLRDKPASANELKIKSQSASSGYQAGETYINKDPAVPQQIGITLDVLKIFAMGTNDVSDIFETPKDFRVFMVQDKYPAKILELSDVVRPGTTVTVYEYIKGNLMSQAQNNLYNKFLNQMINDLRKPENYQILKSGAELDKALTW